MTLTVAPKKLLKINTGQVTIVPDKFLAAFPISLASPTKIGKLRRYRPTPSLATVHDGGSAASMILARTCSLAPRA